jgi:hypothetical protein
MGKEKRYWAGRKRYHGYSIQDDLPWAICITAYSFSGTTKRISEFALSTAERRRMNA